MTFEQLTLILSCVGEISPDKLDKSTLIHAIEDVLPFAEADVQSEIREVLSRLKPMPSSRFARLRQALNDLNLSLLDAENP